MMSPYEAGLKYAVDYVDPLSPEDLKNMKEEDLSQYFTSVNKRKDPENRQKPDSDLKPEKPAKVSEPLPQPPQLKLNKAALKGDAKVSKRSIGNLSDFELAAYLNAMDAKPTMPDKPGEDKFFLDGEIDEKEITKSLESTPNKSYKMPNWLQTTKKGLTLEDYTKSRIAEKLYLKEPLTKVEQEVYRKMKETGEDKWLS